MTFPGLPSSTAKTAVTGPGELKLTPEIETFWTTLQSPVVCVTPRTIGARVPGARSPEAVRENGPNMLLSPEVNMVVIVIKPDPVKALKGKAVPAAVPKGDILAVTKFLLIGVTLVSEKVTSGMLSRLLSTEYVTAEVTNLPGRVVGTPAEGCTPFRQTVVTSFGKKPLPTMSTSTPPKASSRSVPAFGVKPTGNGITCWIEGEAGGPEETPKRSIRSRFGSGWSGCWPSAGLFPSKRRSKSGFAWKTLESPSTCASTPWLKNSYTVGSVPSPIIPGRIDAVCPPGKTLNGEPSAAIAN